MVKAHSPINWENEPSYNTPINEENLNKMDSTIGVLDDRIIEQDTIKLDKSVANTMVSDVSFDDSTGIFTITLLNGSTKTLDTKLEKIATNFRYDYSTQTLILTLIDGTTQSIDMSALVTQYEFTDSATLDFSVSNDGKITATIKNGSITEDMLQPNYLAEIKVETAKSQQSMANAQISENNAKQSELNAKASEEQALEYSNNAQPLAQSVSGNNPTATNSANASLIYLNNKGYAQQEGTPSPDAPIHIGASADKGYFDGVLYAGYYSGTTGIKGATSNGTTVCSNNYMEVKTGDVVELVCEESTTQLWISFYDIDKNYISRVVTTSDVYGDTKMISGTAPTNAKYFTFTISKENGITPSTAKHICVTINGMYAVRVKTINEEGTQYTEALIPVSAPLYEGDYIEVYADGSGQIVRENYKGLLPKSGWRKNDSATKWLEIYSSTLVSAIKDTTQKLKVTHFGDATDNSITYAYNTFYTKFPLGTVEESAIEFLSNTDVEYIAKLTTPTTEPLTAEQVAEFRKLQTFKGVTHVNADGEVVMRYYCDNASGETVSMLQNGIQEIKGLQVVLFHEVSIGHFVGEININKPLNEYTIISVVGKVATGKYEQLSFTIENDTLMKITSNNGNIDDVKVFAMKL